METREFDYIVVGAGSAGCAVAARLAQDRRTTVLLLEAGPRDRNMWIHIPIGYGKTMFNPQLNWQFESEPEPNLDNRKIYIPRGRTLGGSSSINGLVYIRGQKEDFERWRAAGNVGWGWDDVLPYFKRSEANERGADACHGGDGPLAVSDIRGRHPLIEAIIGGANELGVPRTDDFNGARQEGAGYFQLTTRNGLRCSAAKAYLRSGIAGANLCVESRRARHRRDPEGRRAGRVLPARRPRLPGPGALRGGAERRRDPVTAAADAVGHRRCRCAAGAGHRAGAPSARGWPQPAGSPAIAAHVPLHPADHHQRRPAHLVGTARIGLQWILRRAGPVAAGIQLGGMFARTNDSEQTPNVQFHFGTISADMTAGKPHDFPGFTLSVCQLRPTSRGRLDLASPDPLAAPRARFNYLDTEFDRRTMIEGVRMARQLVRTRSLAPYVADEYRPGFNVESDDEVLRFIRGYATTIFHPVGTCRMGPDTASVVDNRLRVRGVDRLRVVDASIMPLLLSGNTNAGSIVIGEKGADMIMEDREKIS